MEWRNLEIRELPRIGSFPIRVSMLYFSHVNISHSRTAVTPEDMLEISIRLEPRDGVCRDVINGRPILERFPNMVWKKPGGRHHFVLDRPRDAISFGYPARRIRELKRLGLYPDLDSVTFYHTPEIDRLCAEYRKLFLRLHTPGAADQMDWVCFRLYREILYSPQRKSAAPLGDGEKLRNIAAWLQANYSQPVDLEALAAVNGFSRAVFYRKWKQLFGVSPAQYVLDLKIEAASRFLRETDLSIGAIVGEIRFSGTTAFHKRFAQTFGMTPGEYRRKLPRE